MNCKKSTPHGNPDQLREALAYNGLRKCIGCSAISPAGAHNCRNAWCGCPFSGTGVPPVSCAVPERDNFRLNFQTSRVFSPGRVIASTLVHTLLKNRHATVTDN